MDDTKEPNREMLKNEPAFPILDPNGSYYREGVSIRAYFAAMAMQEMRAAMMEEQADALIAALNKEPA